MLRGLRTTISSINQRSIRLHSSQRPSFDYPFTHICSQQVPLASGRLIHINSRITGKQLLRLFHPAYWSDNDRKLKEDLILHFLRISEEDLGFRVDTDTAALVCMNQPEWATSPVGYDEMLVESFRITLLPHTKWSADAQLMTRDGMTVDTTYEFAFQNTDRRAIGTHEEIDRTFDRGLDNWIEMVQSRDYEDIRSKHRSIACFTPVRGQKKSPTFMPQRPFMLERSLIRPI